MEKKTDEVLIYGMFQGKTYSVVEKEFEASEVVHGTYKEGGEFIVSKKQVNQATAPNGATFLFISEGIPLDTFMCEFSDLEKYFPQLSRMLQKAYKSQDLPEDYQYKQSYQQYLNGFNIDMYSDVTLAFMYATYLTEAYSKTFASARSLTILDELKRKDYSYHKEFKLMPVLHSAWNGYYVDSDVGNVTLYKNENGVIKPVLDTSLPLDGSCIKWVFEDHRATLKFKDSGDVILTLEIIAEQGNPRRIKCYKE